MPFTVPNTAGAAMLTRPPDAAAGSLAGPQTICAAAECAEAASFGEHDMVVLYRDLDVVAFSYIERATQFRGQHDAAEIIYLAAHARSSRCHRLTSVYRVGTFHVLPYNAPSPRE